MIFSSPEPSGSGSGSYRPPSSSSSTYPSSSSSTLSTATGSEVFPEELQSKSTGFEEFHTNDAPSRVIAALAGGASKDVAQLMCDSGCLPLASLLEAIETLEDFGLVVRANAAGGVVFRLTESGAKTAQMMGIT
jgi:hypothetical protein